MLPRIDDIEAFLAVVQAGSLSAAARRLGLAKSVVSKRVTDLEALLAQPLFQRSTRRLTLTEAGHTFLPLAQEVVQNLSDAIDAVAEPAGAPLRGELRLAAPVSFGVGQLMPVVAAFSRRHPALRIAIDVDDRFVDIAGSGYDLAVRIGRLADSALIARKLALSRRVLCASPSYLAEAGTPASIAELSAHPLIGYANVAKAQQLSFTGPDGAEERLVDVRCALVSNNGDMIREAALAGLGIAALPTFIASEALRDRRLVPVLPQLPLEPDDISAVWPASRTQSRRVRLFVEHLADAFRGTPPWDEGL